MTNLRSLLLAAAVLTTPALSWAQCRCQLCELCLMAEAAGYTSADSGGPAAPTPPASLMLTAEEQATRQTVFVDFDSRTSFSDLQNGLGYTAFEREEIMRRVRQDYELFGFDFVTSQPASGDFSTVWLNDGPSFGIAQQIDFRNLDRNDTATVNVPVRPTEYNRVLVTSTVISHELGHVLGLRHADAFGPIGAGINVRSFAVSGFDYPGPDVAGESEYHIMQTDRFNGVAFETFFGEREAVKLAFNESGVVVNESDTVKLSFTEAEPLQLTSLAVPNTLRVGQFSEGFEVEAITVLGALTDDARADYFSFEAQAGDVVNIEVISSLLNEAAGGIGNRYSDTISPGLRVLDSDGQVLDFYGVEAANTSGPELIDALVLDLLISETGTYFVEVNGQGDFFETTDEEGNPIRNNTDGTPEVGAYELFLFTFGVDSGVRAESEGDFNGDGVVNAADYTLFRDSLASETAIGAGADGNANGVVDPEDYRYWIGNYGAQRDPAAGVPEPAAVLLLAIATIGPVTARRRR
ncbi:dockerin type I domain-containing protein [Botrimarina sp.]|uniref:dockerin type I domain-containing protein n=1 Tax=Botrimarina sp. TaxID=2795802 RepID=UPI0032EF8E4B